MIRLGAIVLAVSLAVSATPLGAAAAPRATEAASSVRDASVTSSVRGADPSARATPPPSRGVADYQLGGPYAPAADVAIVDRDRTAPAVPGRYNICYINAFQSQPGEKSIWARHHLLLTRHGSPVRDPGWVGEYLLDTRTTASRAGIAAILGRWIDGCARAGFQAVEPDNLDSNTRSHRLLTASDNLALAHLLAERAHADGLAIAQKNDAGLTSADRRRVGFDFAVAEECQLYHECGAYTKVYGTAVIEIEYTDETHASQVFRAACRARGARISVLQRDRDVVPRGHHGYRYRLCPGV